MITGYKERIKATGGKIPNKSTIHLDTIFVNNLTNYFHTNIKQFCLYLLTLMQMESQVKNISGASQQKKAMQRSPKQLQW